MRVLIENHGVLSDALGEDNAFRHTKDWFDSDIAMAQVDIDTLEQVVKRHGWGFVFHQFAVYYNSQTSHGYNVKLGAAWETLATIAS